MKEFGMPLWDVPVSIFWFMVVVMWPWLLITISGDLFRDRELSGGGKAHQDDRALPAPT
jgi:hypothetical protein